LTATGSTLVVGGAGGIGSETSKLLAARGERVEVVDRATGVDACDPDAVERFVAGVPDLANVVHLAGSVGRGSIEQHSLDDWRRVLDDNLTTAFVVSRVTVPLLRDRGGGSIVFMSSVNARTGGNRFSGGAYVAAKAGLIGLARHLALDLAPDRIRVNVIAPGPVSTPMLKRLNSTEMEAIMDQVPLRRAAEPAEIAAAIAYLLSSDAASITGAVLDVNGGMWVA
jgi:3-oxoacyl-[acyl-carrier protein] reductase